MERQMERYDNHQDHNRNNSQPANSWSSDDHHRAHAEHQFNHNYMNSEPHDLYGGGAFWSTSGGSCGGYDSGRKRGFHHSGRRASPDHIDAGSYAKLYVAPIPRTATEEDIYPMFAEHGNVVEVVFARDKRTGQRGGYCFVKYTAFEEADTAILALNNQYTFPGELAPIKVRYADGERERLGTLPDRLYVGGINKHTTKPEIQEIFSTYGHIEDIHLVRDELKQHRGYGFIQFSHREMALAAINALNGAFVMRGCDQPLVVRFANPKKPRPGDPRAVSNFSDSVGRHPVPNVSFPVQQIAANLPPDAALHWTNQEATPLGIIQQPHLHPSTQYLEQQQHLLVTRQETLANISAVHVVPPSPQRMDSLECEWSEHTCPDGHKYYYNCETCESRWEKPVEFALFEQTLQNQSKLQNSGSQRPSAISLSTHQVVQTQEEVDCVQMESEASRTISPTWG